MAIKKILWNPWTALVTLAVILSIRIADPSFVESVRLRYFDTLVTSQPAKDIPVNVVNIDEATLDKLGQLSVKVKRFSGYISRAAVRYAKISAPRKL